MGGIIKYSKITTNGESLLNVTTVPYNLQFSPVHKSIFFSNEANATDCYISINSDDKIRVPAGSYIEIAEQYINNVQIFNIGNYEYIARY